MSTKNYIYTYFVCFAYNGGFKSANVEVDYKVNVNTYSKFTKFISESTNSGKIALINFILLDV